MSENQSTSKIPLAKRLVKEILDDYSDVAKYIVMQKANWSSFHHWLRVWQKLLTPAELRAALFVADRTIGYRKKEDKISFKQFRDGVRKKDGKIIHLGSGIKKRDTLQEVLKGLEEISFLEIVRKSGTLIKYRLNTQETLLPNRVAPYPLIGEAPTQLVGSPTTSKILQGKYNKDDDLKNLRDEFIKERGYEPFDEAEILVFRSQKAGKELR